VNKPAQSGLSHCAQLYARAIAQPFIAEAGVCIPTSGAASRPSQKVRSISRFVASVGTTRFGYCLITPCMANDGISYLYSTAASTVATASPVINLPGPSPIGTGYSPIQSLPYDRAKLVDGSAVASPSVKGRIVSYGVRWRYIGTELERGGRVYCLVHPDHDNLYGTDFAQLGQYKECLTFDVTRKWSESVVFSNTSVECNYPEGHQLGNTAGEELINLYPMSSGQYLISGTASTVGSVCGGAPMAVVFDGTPGNQFEFEVVVHVEYVGVATQSMLTKSHADSLGFTIVQESANALGMARQYVTNQALAYAKNQAMAMASQTTLSPGMKMGVAALKEGVKYLSLVA